MSALRFVSLSILAATIAAAASVALAASESEPASRAEVRRQVLQARADGQLARAGEALNRSRSRRRPPRPCRASTCATTR